MFGKQLFFRRHVRDFENVLAFAIKSLYCQILKPRVFFCNSCCVMLTKIVQHPDTTVNAYNIQAHFSQKI